MPPSPRQRLSWHKVGGKEGHVFLGKPRALAPVAMSAISSEVPGSVLPWHVAQDVLLLLERFIEEERGTGDADHWRPLRSVDNGVTSACDLKPLHGPRSSLRTSSLRRSSDRHALRATSFETVLRLHYLHNSTYLSETCIAAMLARAAPVLEDAKAKHRLWRELGWSRTPPKRAAITEDAAVGWRSAFEPARPSAVRCRIEGHWPFPRPAGKPASWSLAN